jgi:hypothetical protein
MSEMVLERQVMIAWLRDPASGATLFTSEIADAFERGEHLKP